MKIIPSKDIIHGVNDSSHFLQKASDLRSSSVTINELFELTKDKRKWSVINPGYLLSLAYSYFVYGYENNILKDFYFDKLLSDMDVKYPEFELWSNQEKCDYLKRRLRNSIAHCRYEVQIRTPDGNIVKDGDLWFVFIDERPNGNDKIIIEVPLPTFVNLIEQAGEYCFKQMNSV